MVVKRLFSLIRCLRIENLLNFSCQHWAKSKPPKMSMTQRENHLLAQIRGPPRQNGTGRVTLKRKLFTWLWPKVKNLLYQQYGLHVNFLNICFSIRNKDRLWHFFSSFKVFDTCSDLEIWLHMTWECHHVISINHQTAWHSAVLCFPLHFDFNSIPQAGSSCSLFDFPVVFNLCLSIHYEWFTTLCGKIVACTQ